MAARVVILGTDGPFTAAVIEALRGLDVLALALPGPAPSHGARVRARPGRTLLAPAGGAVAAAQAAGVAVVDLARPGPGDGWPGALPRPDVLVAACFPWRVPAAWRAAATRAAVNVHPSLLPAYRGPAPLFWQMRADERHTGVTVHHMDDGLDTGDVVLRVEAGIGPHERARAAEARLAGLGASRLAPLLGAPLPRVPQPAEGASRQGWPREDDRVLAAAWPLARAASFLRAAADHGPFRVRTAGGDVLVHEPVEALPGHRLAGPWREEPDGVRAIAFADGVMRTR